MKLVVLDGATLNPGDLSWQGVDSLAETTVYDRTPADLIVKRSAGAEILLTNKTLLTAETLSKLPDLKYIGVLATGYNIVDVVAAGRRGVVVTNVPTYGTNSVAEMVFALLLELVRHVGAHSMAAKQGDWCQSEDFCFWNFPLIELSGKTIGIVGFGRIGRHVGKIASAIGMNVIATDKIKGDPPDFSPFAWVEIDDVLTRSDVISLHCPLFSDTERLINSKTLTMMKSTAFLINTARGGLVVESDLAEALNNGRIAGAALDVLTVEPPTEGNPLLKAKNCFITPHIAWATKEARTRLMNTVVDNLRAFLDGKPINVVSS